MKGRSGVAGKFQCSQCSKQFKYESDRKRHELSHSPRFKCDVCTKKFSFISALRRHRKQHERIGSVDCIECGKKFRDATLLKRHVQYAHKGTFICPNCKATFNSEMALCTHMKTHNPVSKRKYICSKEGCDKSFNFPHHLKHHELTHTDLKQYYCTICEKGFIQSHHLKTHMKTHDPEKWLYCPNNGCKKRFATEYSRKRHLVTHKKEGSENISVPKLPCEAPVSKELDTNVLVDKAMYKEDIDELYKLCTVSPEEVEPTDAIPSKESKCIENSVLDVNGRTTEMDFEITSCKTALGQCIMNGESNCLCAQIQKSDKKYTSIEDLTHTQNSIEMHTVDSHLTKETARKKSIVDNTQTCEDCECGNYRKVVELRNICPNADKGPAVLPDIEFTNDGIVKLKDTIDIDFVDRFKAENESKAFYTSCKAVLGNCIVSGNDTMGEGCLCARMFADDQPMEQEIDDITPKPIY